MANVNADIFFQGNNDTWFTANATLVLADNVIAFHNDGRYKFGDGITQLQNLQFRGISNQSLQQVLTNGNDTVGQNIITDLGVGMSSPSSQEYLTFENFIGTRIGAGNGGVDLFLSSIQKEAYLYALNKITLDSSVINFPKETASRIAIIDASKNIKSAATETYPDLTELSYVKGVTSAIQNQLNTKYTAWRHSFSASFNPADAMYYYFAIPSIAVTNANNNTTNFIRDIGAPKTGTIVAAVISQITSNAPTTTTETSTLVLRASATSTNYTITTTYAYNYANQVKSTVVTGLSIPCTQGQLFQSIIGNPTWDTNPTGVMLTVDYIIQ